MDHARRPNEVAEMRAGAPPAERIVIAGHELEFVRIPSSQTAPALVFLHEGLGSLGLWRDLPARLAESTGCPALVFSRYGNGFSAVLAESRTPSYMHDEARVVLPALLAELSIGDAVLIGHSDGGSIALVYAAEFPNTVRALVLEAPHAFVEDLSVRSIAALAQEYERGGLRSRMTRYHADVDRTFYGWNRIWLAPEFRDWNIEPYVERVRAPILAIQGIDDEYGTPLQIESIARRARGSVDSLLLANCGHAPHRERAALFEAACTAWLRSAALS